MVSLKTIRASNARIGELPAGLVALFMGGTGGVGRHSLLQLAAQARSPKIYITTRRASAAQDLIASLQESNPSGTYVLIEKDVSLLRDTDTVLAQVKAAEPKLDLLFMSAGYISFEGRKDTPESLDPTMTTRFYARARALQQLLPLLNAAPHPRVVAVLGGGMEGKLLEDDLDVRKPGNYSIPRAAVHSVTMLTLFLERAAAANPKISFVHHYPGVVDTGNILRGSSGALNRFFWLLSPLVRLFATTAEDAGAKGAFFATSARYSVDGEDGVPLVEGLERAKKSEGGVFLLNANGERVDNEKVLGDYRRRGVDKQVEDFANEIFEAVSATGKAASA